MNENLNVMSDTLVGSQKIADYLGISRKTFSLKKDEYGIPYYKVGPRPLAKKELLDEWIRNGGSRQEAE